MYIYLFLYHYLPFYLTPPPPPQYKQKISLNYHPPPDHIDYTLDDLDHDYYDSRI